MVPEPPVPSKPYTATSTRGEGGQIAYAIMHFARVLRAAGLPIGPERVVQSIRAIQTVGVHEREHFYWALHAVLVNEHEQHSVFDRAFDIFWRAARFTDAHAGTALDAERDETLTAMARSRRGSGEDEDLTRLIRARPDAPRSDISMSASERELLQTKSFDAMSDEQLALVKQAIARMSLPVSEIPTRRFEPCSRGPRVDMRKTLRLALRASQELIPLARMRRKRRPAQLVLLCDISGSMSHFARMLLHFAHALVSQRRRVNAFVFATRLTNITRELRHKDVERALAHASEAVADWHGGTRIGSALRSFNMRWSRRVLAQGAVVLLITDGLDRDAGLGIAPEMERLHKSCRRLVWLNPLLRYEGFELGSRGMRAILPHVDQVHSIHNLKSLAALCHLLDTQFTRSD